MATPVLDRTYETDAMHNAKIRDNMKRLLSREDDIADLFAEPRQDRASAPVEETPEEFVRRIDAIKISEPKKPYIRQEARETSNIFRADNELNRNRVLRIRPTLAREEDVESEDLRPTQATIQYKTVSNKAASKVNSANAAAKQEITSREKIILFAFIGVVIALFALVIINSAIIASLGNDLAAVKSNIDAAKDSLVAVNQGIRNIVAPENIANFAEAHNMILRK